MKKRNKRHDRFNAHTKTVGVILALTLLFAVVVPQVASQYFKTQSLIAQQPPGPPGGGNPPGPPPGGGGGAPQPPAPPAQPPQPPKPPTPPKIEAPKPPSIEAPKPPSGGTDVRPPAGGTETRPHDSRPEGRPGDSTRPEGDRRTHGGDDRRPEDGRPGDDRRGGHDGDFRNDDRRGDRLDDGRRDSRGGDRRFDDRRGDFEPSEEQIKKDFERFQKDHPGASRADFEKDMRDKHGDRDGRFDDRRGDREFDDRRGDDRRFDDRRSDRDPRDGDREFDDRRGERDSRDGDRRFDDRRGDRLDDGRRDSRDGDFEDHRFDPERDGPFDDRRDDKRFDDRRDDHDSRDGDRRFDDRRGDRDPFNREGFDRDRFETEFEELSPEEMMDMCRAKYPDANPRTIESRCKQEIEGLKREKNRGRRDRDELRREFDDRGYGTDVMRGEGDDKYGTDVMRGEGDDFRGHQDDRRGGPDGEFRGGPGHGGSFARDIERNLSQRENELKRFIREMDRENTRMIRDFNRSQRGRKGTKTEIDTSAIEAVQEEVTTQANDVQSQIDKIKELSEAFDALEKEAKNSRGGEDGEDSFDYNSFEDKQYELQDAMDELNYAFEELHQLRGKGHTIIEVQRVVSELSGMNSELERTMKEFERRKFKQEFIDRVKEMMSENDADVEEIKAAATEIEDPQELQWLVEDQWFKFQEQQEEIHEMYEIAQSGEHLKFANRMLEKTAERLPDFKLRIDSAKEKGVDEFIIEEATEIYNEMLDLVEEADGLINDAEAGDMEALRELEYVMFDIEDFGHIAQNMYRQLGRGDRGPRGFDENPFDITLSIDEQAGSIGESLENGKDFEQLVQKMAAEQAQTMMKQMMQELLKANKTLLDQALAQIESIAGQAVLENSLIARQRVPEGVADEVIRRDTQKIEAIEAIEKRKNSLNAEKKAKIDEVRELFENEVYTGTKGAAGVETAQDFKAFVETEAEELPLGQFLAKVDEYKQDFKKINNEVAAEQVEDGIRKFKDVGLDKRFWYADEAATAKGIFIDGTPEGNFDGAGTLNYAQVLKMLQTGFGHTVREPNAGEAWFAPYEEKAQELGWDIPTDLGKPVPRKDMAKLTVAAAVGNEKLPIVSKSSFGDVSDGKEAIEYMLIQGWVNGCGNDNYCPEDTLNRAQAAKIIVNALKGTGKITTKEVVEKVKGSTAAEATTGATASGVAQ